MPPFQRTVSRLTPPGDHLVAIYRTVMVLRQVGGMLLVGGILALVGAVGLGEPAGSLLFGLTGTDPCSFSPTCQREKASYGAVAWASYRRTTLDGILTEAL